ncbi:MAG: alpha/beta fold hydrolase [Pseudomonadota bacterium]
MRYVLTVAVVLTLLTCVGIWRLADHDLDRRLSEPFNFTSDGVSIYGTLWLPNVEPAAIVVFVHGDGPQDRTSDGRYAPLINAFLDRGIAVAAWDKPGVGASEGNWLLQSMSDRTEEARAGLAQLSVRFNGVARGAVGFSQAGWVLPALTPDDADFIVLIGAAVSWQNQGDYYTRMRLSAEGLDPRQIKETLAKQEEEDERIFGADAVDDDRPDRMPVDRWNFIRQNRTADATDDLVHLDIPLLAIWGADDLNVDAQRNAIKYEELLPQNDAHSQVVVWPDATHSLLKSDRYNWQLTEDWSWFAMARFLAEGRYAYASGAIDVINNWIAPMITESEH